MEQSGESGKRSTYGLYQTVTKVTAAIQFGEQGLSNKWCKIPCLTLFTKPNSRQITDLNVTMKPLKLLADSIGKHMFMTFKYVKTSSKDNRKHECLRGKLISWHSERLRTFRESSLNPFSNLPSLLKEGEKEKILKLLVIKTPLRK